MKPLFPTYSIPWNLLLSCTLSHPFESSPSDKTTLTDPLPVQKSSLFATLLKMVFKGLNFFVIPVVFGLVL
jgi:hypothetical protein